MDTAQRILIIDDEDDLTRMIGFQLTSKGFEVQTAADGIQGLQKVHEFRPDLIILDMNMPRMGGIEFYSKICGPNGRPMFPVLVLTARANIQGLFKDMEIDGFMTKPFEIDHLIAQAELIIKNKARASSNGAPSLLDRPRKVCLVENDQGPFDEISRLFFNADYTVIPARSGGMGIEKMMKDGPDVALVNLGLRDIPGDVLIYRLSQMAQTMQVKFILYTSHDAKHEEKVMERISIKTGIWTFVEYNHLGELLDHVNQLF